MLDLSNRAHDVLSLSANLLNIAQQSWAVFNRYFYKFFMPDPITTSKEAINGNNEGKDLDSGPPSSCKTVFTSWR